MNYVFVSINIPVYEADGGLDGSTGSQRRGGA